MPISIHGCLKKKPRWGFRSGSVDVRNTALYGKRLFKLTCWCLMGGGIDAAISGMAQMRHLNFTEAKLALLNALSKGER